MKDIVHWNIVSHWLNLNPAWSPIQVRQCHLVPRIAQSTHSGQGKMAVNFLTTISNSFSGITIYKFRLTFHWSLFPINNIPASGQIMTWRRPGDKPLSEPMMVNLLTHICVNRPQWVKNELTEITSRFTEKWSIDHYNGNDNATFGLIYFTQETTRNCDQFQLVKRLQLLNGQFFIWN